MSILFLFYVVIFNGDISFYLFTVDDEKQMLLGAIENDGIGVVMPAS